MDAILQALKAHPKIHSNISPTTPNGSHVRAQKYQKWKSVSNDLDYMQVAFLADSFEADSLPSSHVGNHKQFYGNPWPYHIKILLVHPCCTAAAGRDAHP